MVAGPVEEQCEHQAPHTDRASQPAYQRAGRALRSMREPSSQRAKREAAEERGDHRQHCS